MSDPYLIAVGIIGSRELTDELLNEVMGKLPLITPGLSQDELLNIRKQLEATIGISMVAGQGLHDVGQDPWLEDAKSRIQWHYWNAYKTQLKSTGMSNDVIRVLDEDTDNILNECGCPSTDTGWRIQGLVMGDVQSGKTANYCGLINKAADAGYKFVVLLTGMIEELRSQTQERMDAGFVGRDSRTIFENQNNRSSIGSGRFRSAVPNVLTSIDCDFLTANKRVLGGIPLENIKEPVLLVMKKNRAPLQNLVSFLDSQMPAGHKQLALPLLLVDDEADNASVNAKKDEDPATINKLIRSVIKRFVKATYVAYTATPFANVFINPDKDDLFPSNFVYSLNTPTNYVGVAGIFSDEGEHDYQVKDIDDADAVFPYKHKKDLPISTLPRSLEEALEAFLLSCAIRDLRREPLKHRSMLINVTRFTDVQGKISKLVKERLYSLTEDIKQYLADDTLWQKHQRLQSLFHTWNELYGGCEFTWNEIRKSLYGSIASVKVVTINQKSDQTDRLNYGLYKNTEKGRRVVAIGGLTLSRGLTLEGLCISYFYRNSKAYDTLLQMGRWFGYRPGYADLCRIWMDPIVQDWFAHVSEVIDELRFDIRRMHVNRQPPSKFGMRIKSHADALIVTAANKMRNSQDVEVSVSYSGSGAETPFIPKVPELNAKNLSTVAQFLGKLGPAKMTGNRCYWEKVKSADIATFLKSLEISNMNMHFIPDITGRERPIFNFIERNDFEELAEWDICLPQGNGNETSSFLIDFGNAKQSGIKPRHRQFEYVAGNPDFLKLNKQRVGEISDEKFGLSPEDLNAANEEWGQETSKDPSLGKTVPGYVYRRYRKRPLLTIHIIEPQDPKQSQGEKKTRRMMPASEIESKNLVAIGLSFPRFGNGEKELVPYRLNKVALRTMGLILDDEEQDDDQD